MQLHTLRVDSIFTLVNIFMESWSPPRQIRTFKLWDRIEKEIVATSPLCIREVVPLKVRLVHKDQPYYYI